jgi:predicted PurR-regulated permease PerM
LRNKKQVHIVEKFLSLNIIIIFLYLGFIGMVFFALSDLLPQIVKELKDVTRYVPALSDQVTSIANKLEEIKNFNTQL